jgi:hypothetical protein
MAKTLVVVAQVVLVQIINPVNLEVTVELV